ncbi:hypothetical protein IMSHALPRED_008837 [Imshaugia aleurites]|uniref:Uncharacterized protein n=1 Tax=Imshaugia aleurites TaxID=172621 RepID=A0A8H3FY68_9LECA|nr:hypothetical protein IMSHALPRED_008837 [Imshaugia aleurites]
MARTRHSNSGTNTKALEAKASKPDAPSSPRRNAILGLACSHIIDQTESYLNMIASSTSGDIESILVLRAPRPLDSSSNAAGKERQGHGHGQESWTKGCNHASPRSLGMGEVLTTLVARIWQKGLRSMVADVHPRNKGSTKVLNRSGSLATRKEEYARD